MSDQVGEFLDKATTALKDAPPEPRDQPLVPFQTPMKLTRDREKKMLDHAFKRLKELSDEAGRDTACQPNWWANISTALNPFMASQGFLSTQTFMQKRARFDATFHNDVSWRPWTMGGDNIFMQSNLTVPLSRRIARQMIARAKNSFFGSDPWFSIEAAPNPASELDEELAWKIESFVRFKLGESESKEYLGGAIELALTLGECPVFTTYTVRDQIFGTEATVLTDIDGQQVKGADGNIITPDDEFVDAQDGNGTQVLKRDGQTLMPDAPLFQSMTLNRRQVLFEGARSEPIYYKDFLCPLTATDVQTADCIAHLYDKPVMQFVDLVVKRGMVEDTAEGRLGAAQRLVSLVKKMDSNTSRPKAAVTTDVRPNENYGTLPDTKTGGPVAEFVNFFMWYDVYGDGILRNVMLVADRQTESPVFYDFVPNVTTDGLRPIEIVRINPVKGRWYGLGIIELFESYQTWVDLMVNRWNQSQSAAGRTDFWDPTATLEGDANPSLQMNRGKSYTLKPGKKAEDALSAVYLNDTKFEQIYRMLQLPMQLAVNESGVANANDAQSAGLESSELATGIQNIQQSGDELFKPIIADLTGPLNRILGREVSVTLANMNPEEAYSYMEGDTRGVDKLTPDDVRGLKFKVKISLTTQHNQQVIQTSAAAAALVEKYYMLTPEIQARVAPFYRAQIRALDPKCDVEHTIQPMPPAPAQSQPPKLSVAVALKGEDLSPEEKQELISKIEGGQPDQSDTGSTEKLGDAGAGGSTPFPAQLSQRMNKKAG